MMIFNILSVLRILKISKLLYISPINLRFDKIYKDRNHIPHNAKQENALSIFLPSYNDYRKKNYQYTADRAIITIF